jgi:hypothetical protein
MTPSFDDHQCETCGKPAMHGLTQCSRCLAESILREREKQNHNPRSAKKSHSASMVKSIGGILAVVCALAMLGGIFYLNSARVAFNDARKRDTVIAYEVFLKKHSGSEYAVMAQERAAELDYADVLVYPNAYNLRDFVAKWPRSSQSVLARAEIQRLANEKWQTIAASNDSRALKQFINDYPEAKELPMADAKLKEIGLFEAWDKMKNSTDLDALANFAKANQGHETAQLANQLIHALCNDYDWIVRQDKLQTYRAYLKLNPDSPNKAQVEKRIIDLEVAEILAGKHGKLPPSSPLQRTGGTETQMRIENQTSYSLTLRYSGRQSYRFDLRAGEVRDVILAADTYQVAATVNSANVTPYAGKDTLQGGHASTKFYIETRRW